MLSVASGQETVETTDRLDLTFQWSTGTYKFDTCMTHSKWTWPFWKGAQPRVLNSSRWEIFCWPPHRQVSDGSLWGGSISCSRSFWRLRLTRAIDFFHTSHWSTWEKKWEGSSQQISGNVCLTMTPNKELCICWVVVVVVVVRNAHQMEPRRIDWQSCFYFWGTGVI